MNRPGFWIVVVLVITWQIVGRLIQRAAAKERQRKLAEMARSPRTQPAGASAPAPPAPAPRPSGQDLAARRRAQIEELRQRRETRLGPASPAPVQRPRPAAMPRPAARPAGRPVAIPIPPRPPTPLRPPTASKPPAPARPPPAEEPADEPMRLVEETPHPRSPPPARRPATVFGEKFDRSSLRRMVVLREILDPPVSLREPYTAAP